MLPQSFLCASSSELMYAERSSRSASPLLQLPYMGPAACITNFAASAKPGVMAAPPVRMGASLLQASCSFLAPAALKMAPQTPPPMIRAVLAAFTIASVSILVMSCRTIVNGISLPPAHEIYRACIIIYHFCRNFKAAFYVAARNMRYTAAFEVGFLSLYAKVAGW